MVRTDIHRPRGFTLIELLIVVAIGGIFCGAQFTLMVEGVRRHDRVTKQAVAQGEAANVLKTFGDDARAAVDLPGAIEGIPLGEGGFLMVRKDDDGERIAVVYSLEPGERTRAGKDGLDVYLDRRILTRSEWRLGEKPEETGRRVVARSIDRFQTAVLAGFGKPVVTCVVATADVSDGKRVIENLASAFTPRVEWTTGAEEGVEP